VDFRHSSESLGFYRTDFVRTLGAPAIKMNIAKKQTAENIEKHKGIDAPLESRKKHPQIKQIQ